eukprot:tig00020539_g10417.t1
MAAAPSSISSILVSGLAWTLTPGLFSTPSYPNLTVACTWNGETRTAVLQGIPDVATSAQAINVTGFTPSTLSHPVSCSATLYYSTGGPATGTASTVSTAATYCVASNVTMACPGLTGLAINTTLIPSSTSWHTTSYECIPPAFETVSVSCTGPRAGSATYQQNSTEGAVASNEPSAFVGVAVPPLAGSVAYQCRSTLHYVGVRFNATAAHLVQAAMSTCLVPAAPVRFVADNALALTVTPTSTTSIATSSISWLLLPPAGAIDTPVYGNMTLTCTGNGVTQFVTASPLAGVSSAAPMNVTGLPETSSSYDITCNASLPYGSGSVAAASVVVPSVAAKDVASTLAFNVSVLNGTAVVTTPIVWALTDSGAADTPAYKSLTVNCESNGVTRACAAVLGTRIPNAATTSESGLVITGLPDTASYHVYCAASLLYSYAGVATGSAAVIVPDKVVVNNSLSMAAAPSSISSILVSGLAWTLTPGLFSTPSYPNLTVACTWNGETRTAVLQGIPDVATSAQAINVTGFTPSTSSHPVSCSATLYYSTGGPATGAASTVSTAATYCVASNVTMACPGLTGLAINTTLIPSSTSWHTTSYECIPPAFETVSVSCTGPRAGSATYQQNSTAGALVSNEPSAFVGVAVPPLAGSVAYQCRSTLHYVGVRFNATAAHLVQAAMSTCLVPAAPVRFVADNALALTVTPTSTTSIATSSISWLLLPPAGAIDTPVYGNMTLTCTGNGVTQFVTASLLAGVSSAAPMNVTGLPETSSSYDITCNASLPYGSGSVAAASVVVPSVAAKDVASTLAFNVSVLNATAVVTTPIVWALTDSGAADTPAYKSLTVNCESNGVTRAAVLGTRIPNAATTSESGLVITGLPDTASYHVYCTASLLYSYAGVATGSAAVIVPDKVVVNNSLSMAAAPSSISSILVSGLAWTLTPGLFSTPSYPNLTVACTWNGETRTAVLQGIPDVATSAQAINVTGFTPSTSSHPVSCSATLYYSTGGPATGAASTVSTAATYCVASNVTMACPGLTGLAINTTLIPSSTSWHTTSYECIPPAFETVSVSCTGPGAGSATYLQNSTAGAVVSNEPSAFVGVAVPPLAGSVAYQCRSTLHYVGTGYSAIEVALTQSTATTCVVPPVDTPVYGNMTLTCTGNGVTQFVTASLLAGVSSAAPMNVTGLPETSSSYDITCNASLPYGSGSVAAASVVVPSVAAKDVASTLAFNVSVLNATAVVTTPIVWALTDSGAADTPAYKSLTVNCESNGVTRAAVLGTRIPNAATTSESGLVITGLPDTASYHVYCTASLLYSYAGVATGSAAVIVPDKVVVNNSLSMAAAPSSISSILVSGLAWTLTPGLFSTPTFSNITVACTVNGLTLETIVKTLVGSASAMSIAVPDKVVVNNSLSMAAAPSSISSILVSGLAWTLTPGLFSTPSYPNLTVACTWNGETRTAVLQGIPDVATSAQAINVTGFTPSTSSHPVSCSATLYYSTGGPATGAASTMSTAAMYCVASNVTMACPGLTGLAINTTLIPSSTSWHTTSYECIPPAFKTVSVSCTGPRAGSATYQQNSTAGAVASNEPSAFVGVAVPPLAGSVAYQCRSTLHYVGTEYNATKAIVEQQSPTTCVVPAARARLVAEDALAFSIIPISTTAVSTSSITWALTKQGAIDTPVYGKLEAYRIYCTAVLAYGENRTASGIASALSLPNATLKDASNGQALPTYTATPTPSPNANASAPSTASSTIRIGNQTYEVSADGSSENAIVISMQEPVVQIPQNASDELVSISLEGLVTARSGENEESDAGDVEVYLLSGEGALSDSEAIMLDARMQNNEVQFRVPSLSEGKRRRALSQFEAGRAYDVQIKSSTDAFPSLRIANALSWSAEVGAGAGSSSSGDSTAAAGPGDRDWAPADADTNPFARRIKLLQNFVLRPLMISLGFGGLVAVLIVIIVGVCRVELE